MTQVHETEIRNLIDTAKLPAKLSANVEVDVSSEVPKTFYIPKK